MSITIGRKDIKDMRSIEIGDHTVTVMIDMMKDATMITIEEIEINW